ncbi:MAG: NHLP leader peptide family RiPP precursor [Thermoanaerobaculia bacterium]
MSQNAKTRSTVESSLIRKAWADEEFKKKLMANPTATYAAESKEAGTALPAGTEVRAIEESKNTLYLVLPNVEIDPKTEVKLHDRSTRADFEAALIVRASREPEFKKQLLANPKAAYVAQLASVRAASTLPEDLTVKAYEESGNVLYFRLPQPPAQGGELSEVELEAVAGGAVAVGVAIASTVVVGAVAAAVLLAQDV